MIPAIAFHYNNNIRAHALCFGHCCKRDINLHSNYRIFLDMPFSTGSKIRDHQGNSIQCTKHSDVGYLLVLLLPVDILIPLSKSIAFAAPALATGERMAFVERP